MKLKLVSALAAVALSLTFTAAAAETVAAATPFSFAVIGDTPYGSTQLSVFPQRIGQIHLDLHPRDRKYNHAAQFDLVPGVRERQLPEGVLVCNFNRGLMEHQEVVTLFHEFGHLMHHVLAGRHEWVRFSGVATEWDFVEAPSQMLEEWAWDAAVLQLFARDADGTPIPTELVARMRAADEFGKGFLARTFDQHIATVQRLSHVQAGRRSVWNGTAADDALQRGTCHFPCGNIRSHPGPDGPVSDDSDFAGYWLHAFPY